VAIDLATLRNDGDTVAVLEDHEKLIESIIGRGMRTSHFGHSSLGADKTSVAVRVRRRRR
jgi:hypothetical protein